MATTMVTISDEVMERLWRIADERGLAIDNVIQEMLDEATRELPPIPTSLGFGASGYSDTASDAGDLRSVPRSWR